MLQIGDEHVTFNIYNALNFHQEIDESFNVDNWWMCVQKSY